MNVPKNFQITIAIVLLIALIFIVFKAKAVFKKSDNFFAEQSYRVTYRYFFTTNTGTTSVKAYLPKNNSRQQIKNQKSILANTIAFKKQADGNNIKGLWFTNNEDAYESINYQFAFEGKSKSFMIPERFRAPSASLNHFLVPTDYIQSEAPEISELAVKLAKTTKNDRDRIKAIFTHVKMIPSAPIITLTDALTVIKRNKASCNGKSRLLVALARNLGYPARIRGGIILKESNKRTSHAWVEIFINDSWVPFDALNGHFAYLPANYLELYEGDEFLVTHTSGIQFDYAYEIEKQESFPFLNGNIEETEHLATYSFLGLVKSKVIKRKNLFLLLMLPLGGLLVALLRNVVGLRTFGVFLPVLIAFSLLETGYLNGLLLFLFLILFVGLIARPFNSMGLLHTPKLVISLTLMVIVMTIGSYMGLFYGIEWLTTLTFFPTIILTISAERFSTLIVEDGFQMATGTLLQTLLTVSICYAVFSIKYLDAILILFPEVLLLIIGFAMLLGKYVGLRWTEILRFKPLLNLKIN